MDPDRAKQLFEEGAIIIVDDMPVGNEFGIDYNWWNTGQKFKGLKMIPAGLHFIFTRAAVVQSEAGASVAVNANSGPRCGFFHFFEEREVIWLQWDKENELLVRKEIDEENVARIQHNLMNLDQNLGPYPFENLNKWHSLTSYITQQIILKMQPQNVMITSVSQYLPRPYISSRQNRHQSNTAENEVDIKLDPKSIIRFSEIPKRKFPDTATPSQITAHSMDKSYTLDYVIESCHNNDENQLLGELQLAFTCFLIAQVYDGFEQWKRIIDLLCSCQAVINRRVQFYRSFLRMLNHQLQEVPEDFFVDIVSSDNFLAAKLNELFDTLQDPSLTSKELAKEAEDFRQILTARFQWDFESEPDDYGPVIVTE